MIVYRAQALFVTVPFIVFWRADVVAIERTREDGEQKAKAHKTRAQMNAAMNMCFLQTCYKGCR